MLPFSLPNVAQHGQAGSDLDHSEGTHWERPKILHFDGHSIELERRIRGNAGQIGHVLHNENIRAKQNRMHRARAIVGAVYVERINADHRRADTAQAFGGILRQVGMAFKILVGLPML